MRSIPDYGSAEWAEEQRKSQERARQRRIEESGPDLLKALKATLQRLRFYEPDGIVQRQAVRAIEKAGEQP